MIPLFKQFYASRASVRLGEHKISTNPDCNTDESICKSYYEEFDVENFTIHESYSDQLKVHDIALIRLSTTVTLKKQKKNVNTVCLPTEESHDFTKGKDIKNFTIAGWGSTGNGTTKSDVLMYAAVPYIPEDICKSTYEEQQKIHKYIRIQVQDTHLCAGGLSGVDS